MFEISLLWFQSVQTECMNWSVLSQTRTTLTYHRWSLCMAHGRAERERCRDARSMEVATPSLTLVLLLRLTRDAEPLAGDPVEVASFGWYIQAAYACLQT